MRGLIDETKFKCWKNSGSLTLKSCIILLAMTNISFQGGNKFFTNRSKYMAKSYMSSFLFFSLWNVNWNGNSQ